MANTQPQLPDDEAIEALREAAKTVFRASTALFESTGKWLDDYDGNKSLRLVELIHDVAGELRMRGASLLGEAELWAKSPPGEDADDADAAG
jgi:hypothetical protein